MRPEYHVEKDPRTGDVEYNPVSALRVNATKDKPADGRTSIFYAGKYYSVADTEWDWSAFYWSRKFRRLSMKANETETEVSSRNHHGYKEETLCHKKPNRLKQNRHPTVSRAASIWSGGSALC